MATSGDVEEMPEPGTDHPAEPCMGVGVGGDQLWPMMEEISRSLAAEATSDHHEAAQSEQSAERSTSESELESVEKVPAPVAAKTASDHYEAAAVIPKNAVEGSTLTASEEEVPVPSLVAKDQQEAAEDDGQESARERLKRHRREMAGRVWVPDMWGQEKLLKDWVDCAVFDRPLVPPDLLTARRALVAECCTRRPDRTPPPAGSSPLRVPNSCS